MDVILKSSCNYLCCQHSIVHLLESVWLGVFTSVYKPTPKCEVQHLGTLCDFCDDPQRTLGL